MRKVVSVAFQNGPKTYDYFTDLSLKTGDYVVVPAGSLFSVAIVKKLKETSQRAEKWVVQKVDIKGYHERLAELMFE